jgi:hypothetical protein
VHRRVKTKKRKRQKRSEPVACRRHKREGEKAEAGEGAKTKQKYAVWMKGRAKYKQQTTHAETATQGLDVDIRTNGRAFRTTRNKRKREIIRRREE